MPKGPRGEKRPADVVSAAIMVGKIATGEIAEQENERSAAAELGRKGGLKGGKARAAGMTKKQRTAAAKNAAASRWKDR